MLVVVGGDSGGGHGGGREGRTTLRLRPLSDLPAAPLPIAQGVHGFKMMCAPTLLPHTLETQSPGILCPNSPSLLPGRHSPLLQVCSLNQRDSLPREWGDGRWACMELGHFSVTTPR